MNRLTLLSFIALTLLGWIGPANSNILVIAPHPDDDILISAGVTYAATQRGEQVTVVYVTNGDANGLGDPRQDEAVLGQTSNLGTRESDLIFLGYPDEGLKTIYQNFPLASDRFLTARGGHTTTYAHRGLGGTDYHNFRFGSHANYNRFNLLADLKDIIDTQRPEHIITVTESDVHTDHQTTSIATRDAILAVTATDPSYIPVLNKMMVWSANSSIWPESANPLTYFNEPPGLVGTGLSWDEHESLDVPLAMQVSGMVNLKNRAISAHTSQGGNNGFIGTFAHKDEFFWPVNVNGGNFPPRVDAGFDQSVTQGATVLLNGSGSKDPEGVALAYQWRQIEGPAVTLANTTTAKPSFTAPSGSSADLTLVFELRVNDGLLNTLPDHVSVRVLTPSSAFPNIAPLATVTASSQNVNTQQQAVKAVDGVVDGYPGNYTREWATVGEGAGAWIQLNWSSPYQVSRIVLHDRPNTDELITGATLTFSSGATIEVGALNDAGVGVEFNVGPFITNSLRVTVTTVSGSTKNVGLSELEVYGIQPAAGGNLAPAANAGADQTVAQGALVKLNGNGSSDPNGDALTSYRWTQTDGPSVILAGANTATPSFTSPVGLSATATLTFALVVNDGQVDSAPDPVNIVVTAAPKVGSNIASLATVTASSENSGTSQQAVKAVDGVLDGYPGDYTREWATLNGLAGSWLELNWATFYQVDHVVLYDRPNSDDQITGATLTFSDGSTVTVGALNNAGAGVTINFTPKLTTRVRLTVTTVSGTTHNAGLSELEVYGAEPTIGDLPPTANAGSDLTVSEGAAVFLDGRASADPNSDPLTYHWVQTAGPIVSLLSANTSTPTFSAPSGLTTKTILTFSLVVNDGHSNSPVDLINITVTPLVGNLAPFANAGPDQSAAQGVLVKLNGSASSDPNGDALTSYHWTQTGGPSVILAGANTATPSFTSPVGLSATATLTFALVVNDGQVDSAPDPVNIVVTAAPKVGSNIASLATVTASSENSGTSQQAVKAVDGVLDGYPGNYTREWATLNGLAGSWLELNWGAFYQVDHVVLYDRPNSDDQITGATLTFSDGSTVTVGALNNAGAGVTVNFTPKLTTRVRLTVTTVSGTTHNVGLSELEVYGVAPTISSLAPT
jgi:LmbE family N-acetylglucosaminyl deacetylase